MDKALKQRLVGASILIALAVIFLPMLFDGGDREGGEQRELSVDLPEQPAGERRVRRIALEPSDEPAVPTGSRAEPTLDRIDSAPASGADQRDPPPVRDQQIPPAAVDPEPEPEPEPLTPEASDAEESAPIEAPPEPMPSAPAAPEPTADGDWSVQVAVFSNQDTAGTIRQRLESLGHAVRQDVLIRNNSELHRLRTGPYANRSEAERARTQIASTVAGVDPVVRELETAGDERPSGLAVQVGSFASRTNAVGLSNQLTAAGYDAFIHDEDAGGRTIWRVRVGSFADRADADQLLDTLRENEGLDGIVVSHP